MNIFIFLAMVSIGVISPICIKGLVLKGYGYADLIFWRSIVAIILVAPFLFKTRSFRSALFSKISLARFFIGGTLLSLSVFAYSYLSATDVKLLSRFDLPLFLMFFSSGPRRIAASALVIFGVFYSFLQIEHGYLVGVVAVWTSTILTSVSYWLIRHASEKKCLATLVLPPYIGAAVVSFLLLHGKISLPSFPVLAIICVTSASAVGLYIFSAALFARTRMGTVELTGSVALLCTYPAERLILGDSPSMQSAVAAVVSVVFCLVLVYWEILSIWLKKKVLQL